VIHHNKLKLFGSAFKKSVSKGRQQLISLKSDVGLLLQLYIGCQTRDGNLAALEQPTKEVIYGGSHY
jgi:hypothetical protein